MKTNRTILIFILGLLSAIGPFSIDTYLSGFPIIAQDLGVTVDYVSYTLSSFFIGISIGQMLYGPLLDRFGRKKPMLIGLTIYVLASVACALASSIESLILFRLLQALGGCVGMVSSRAVVRDMFPVHESAKIFSILILILGVSPMIAPTVGSYMIVNLGWHSVFWLQAGMGLFILLSVFFFLPETKEADPALSLAPADITKTFWGIFKNPQFFTYAFAGSMVSGGIYAYVSGSPYVFMKIFRFTEQQFGWIFSLLAGGLILSSQLNNLVLKKFNSEQIVKCTLSIQTIFGLILFAFAISGQLTVYSAIVLIFLFLCCQGFSFPNASALSLAPFSKEAGSASALMGAFQMGIGSLGAALVGVLSNGTTLPMTGVMAGCALLGLVIFSVGRSFIRKEAK
jgi:DHA1 family bicyclomycin/chloramphenicol resistance-like MFS transporter